MSRKINTTARLFGHRRDHYLRAAVVFVLVSGIALGVIGLRGHGKALAQALQPAPVQAPQLNRYTFAMQKMEYFYFMTDGGVVIQFESRPRLILQPAETVGIRHFVQQSPHPLAPQRIGNYFINASEVQYWQNKDDGGAVVHFGGCPSIDLKDPRDVEQLKHAVSEAIQAANIPVAPVQSDAIAPGIAPNLPRHRPATVPPSGGTAGPIPPGNTGP